jgi:hypothetical protein
VDVLIFGLQIMAVIGMAIGIFLIEDTGLQIFLLCGFVLAALVAIEARRSA